MARVEREALEALLQRPMDLIGSGFEELEGASFSVPSYRAVHDAIRAVGGLDGFVAMLQEAEARMGVGEDAQRAATRAFDEAVREMAGDIVGGVVTQLAVAPLPQDRPDGLRGYARGVMAALVRMDLTRRTADARAALQRLDPDDPDYAQAFQELMKLEQRRQTYSAYEQ